jgi:hypothetical protein
MLISVLLERQTRITVANENCKSVEEIQAIMAAKRGGGSVNNRSFTKLPEARPIGQAVTVPAGSKSSVQTNELAKMTKNQKMYAIDTLLDKYGLHPVEEMIKWIQGKQDPNVMPLTSDQRVKLLSELASYTVPKLKSVEHNVTGEVGMTIRIVKFGDAVKEDKILEAEVVDQAAKEKVA